MTPRKPVNPDAIAQARACELLNMKPKTVQRLRRQGLLVTLPGYPSYSLADVQAFVEDPWLNGSQAAAVLGVSRSRVSQLADAEKIPVRLTAGGRRVYRLRQLEVVAHARRAQKRT